MKKFIKQLKGVGAATLDRGISLVIAGVVLAGIVAGISWLYDTHKKESFMNNLHVISTAVKGYYHNDTTYTNINLANVQKAGNIPVNVSVTEIANYNLTALDGMATLTTAGITGITKAFQLNVATLPYNLCMITGQDPLNDVIGIYGATNTTFYPAADLPINDVTKLGDWETFCDVNEGGTVGFVFE